MQADAIAQYSHLFRRSEGLYLSFPNQDNMERDFLEQVGDKDIDLVVCSDGEAILGIGDQGVGVSDINWFDITILITFGNIVGHRRKYSVYRCIKCKG